MTKAILKTEKHQIVLEVAGVCLPECSQLVLDKPEGHVLASMSFFKSNVFEIEINGVIYHDAKFIELAGEKLDHTQMVFEYQSISRKETNVS